MSSGSRHSNVVTKPSTIALPYRKSRRGICHLSLLVHAMPSPVNVSRHSIFTGALAHVGNRTAQRARMQRTETDGCVPSGTQIQQVWVERLDHRSVNSEWL
jgi:hypothetical protein